MKRIFNYTAFVVVMAGLHISGFMAGQNSAMERVFPLVETTAGHLATCVERGQELKDVVKVVRAREKACHEMRQVTKR